MIDTVEVMYRLSATPELVRVQKKNGQETRLSLRYTAKVESLRTVVFSNLTIDGTGSDLRVTYINDARVGAAIYAVVSLPKLLYQTNSFLITTQRELDSAIAAIRLILEQKGFQIQSGPYVRRLHLVWNFPQPPHSRTLLAHFATRHAGMHQAVSLHHRGGRLTGITWEGSSLTINMYDQVAKKREVIRGRAVPSENFLVRHLRVEAQLEDNKIRTQAMFGRELRSLKLRECYRCYRNIMCNFLAPDESLYFGPDTAKQHLIDFASALPPRRMPVPKRQFLPPALRPAIKLMPRPN